MGTVNYDQDFYGWTVEQVALLQNKQFDQIDLEHIMSLTSWVCSPLNARDRIPSSWTRNFSPIKLLAEPAFFTFSVGCQRFLSVITGLLQTQKSPL